MTDAEIIELALLSLAQATTMLSIYLTLTFAFIMTSYVVGEKLSKIQARVICGLYLIGVIPTISGNYYHTIRSGDFENMVTASYPIIDPNAWGTYSVWAGFMVFIMASGAMASLYLLYSVRVTKRAT
jgi:hypothetical protein